MNGHLILTDGTEAGLKPADAGEALHAGKLLWVDLHDSSEESLALLRDVFQIHPLAVEDAAEFGQRPKMEEYDHFVSIVFFGSSSVGQPMTEVHLFYGENFLVTMHREPCVAFGGMRQAMQRHRNGMTSRLIVLHHVLDNALLSQRVELPGMTREHEPYFRDLYDHLIRISDMVDSHRDVLGNSVDAYMSMMSNRQSDVMKQLTIMATIFLPLSFLTGFFGQNFGWLVSSIGSPETFFGVGLGTELLAVIGLFTLFKRRGWL